MANTKSSAYPDLVVDRGNSAVNTSQVTIGATSATLLAANLKRGKVLIKNTHATQTLHVSGATPATAANGFSVEPASAEIVSVESTAILYAISDGAGTVVELMEFAEA